MKVSLFKGFTEGLTGGIGSLAVKAVADGAVNQIRGKVGLDNTVQYTYTSEKPAAPGSDPRPWENVKRTSHSLSLSASMPLRAVLNAVFRTQANKGGRLENNADIGLDKPLGKLADISVAQNNVLKWNYVDGELESIAIYHETRSSTNVNLNPSVGLGLGVDTGLSVKTSVKERMVMMRPTLVMLLALAENILFGDTGLRPVGGEQILKGLLAKNYAGVNYMLAHLMDEEHAAKTSEIYAKAQVAATGDFERLSRLHEAWQAVNTLPADATPDAKVDAAHRLIVELVRAFRV